jgi:hypothetical protein
MPMPRALEEESSNVIVFSAHAVRFELETPDAASEVELVERFKCGIRAGPALEGVRRLVQLSFDVPKLLPRRNHVSPRRENRSRVHHAPPRRRHAEAVQ